MGKFINMCEKLGVTYSYSSLQVDIPLYIAKDVMDYSRTIPKSMLYEPLNEKGYGIENEIHCTVLYGIHVLTAEQIINVIEKYRLRPFNLCFGSINYFEQTDYDVMKIDIESPYLYKINNLMRQELDYTNKYLKYKPHCTIAYLQKGAKEQYPFEFDKFSLTGRELWVTELTFCSKTGQREILPLNGQAGYFRRFVDGI